jgi:hypothetical protein
LLKGKQKQTPAYYFNVLLAKGKIFESNLALLQETKKIFDIHFAAQPATIV